MSLILCLFWSNLRRIFRLGHTCGYQNCIVRDESGHSPLTCRGFVASCHDFCCAISYSMSHSSLWCIYIYYEWICMIPIDWWLSKQQLVVCMYTSHSKLSSVKMPKVSDPTRLVGTFLLLGDAGGFSERLIFVRPPLQLPPFWGVEDHVQFCRYLGIPFSALEISRT